VELASAPLETIASAAARLRRGETSAAALVDASLAAIAAHQARTNAFTTVHADRARDEARRADRELTDGVDRGPLHGIPVSIKDLIDEAGVVTTAGSTVLDDRVPGEDATVVRRLREAGAIIIGRTNLQQFAFGTTSDDSSFGPVRHPEDPERSSGGSSGGAAAAVVTGMGLAALGTDTGGSVRIPAAACGLVGLKPGAGEVPNDGVIPLSVTLDHVGPLVRSVQDAGWVCDVLAGRTPDRMVPRPVDTLRFMRLTGYFEHPLDPGVRGAYEAALERLTSAGASLAPRELPATSGIAPGYDHIALPEAVVWHAPYLEARADRYSPTIRERILQGRAVSAVQYLEALAAAAALRHEVDALLEDADALLTPTLPIVAPPLGAIDVVVDPTIGTAMPARGVMLKHTQPFNLTGHPAITIPVPSGGLPVGLQLVGRRGGTAGLLAIAAACEGVLRA
jgi:aspartyl-tRNA(Asn)/glutamyl-tRNA(Gln) amidotransferase subunit A